MAKATVNKALKNMDAYLVQACNENIMPGLAVGVVHQGELVYQKAFGYADLERKTPVTMDTVFRIMSISKTFTALAIMQLWEGKHFDLDDPVNAYLKLMKVLHRDVNAPPITFRHLLTHTSGIGEMRGFADMTRPVGGLGAKPDTRILSMPEYYNGLLRADIYPGQKWAYANHGYAVLAQLIEDISGESFPMYMRRNIFEPLGMMNSDYFMSERVRGQLAQGYQLKKGAFKPVDYLRLNTPGCGGIFSTITDMVKYVSALMNRGVFEGGKLLKPETLKMMMTSQLDTDLRVFGMGFGFLLRYYGEHLSVRHGGGWPGFISEMTVVPDQKLAVLVFNNSSSSAPGLIAKEMLYSLLDLPNPDETLPDPTILQQPANWEQLCGFFGPKPGFLTNWRIWNGFWGEIEVYVKDNQLMMRGLNSRTRKGFPLHRADRQDPLYFKAKVGKQSMPVLFTANEHGKIERLNVMQYELYKRPLQQSLKFKALAALGGLVGVLLTVFGLKLLKKK